MQRIILASGSPRRRELLKLTGLDFDVIPGNIDENEIIRNTEGPQAAVEALAEGKAKAVADQVTDGIVIGADTIVWDNEIMGKPSDRDDAYRMLRKLQGKTHSVFTGVSLIIKNAGEIKTHTFSCKTSVKVCPMTEQETQSYIETGEPMDKAGAYGIQGKFGIWVEAIEGDYNNVVGLPVCALWQVLKQYVK